MKCVFSRLIHFFSATPTTMVGVGKQELIPIFTEEEKLRVELRIAHKRVSEWRNHALNYSAEVRRLQYGLIQLREGLEKNNYSTVWYSNCEKAVDFITALLNGQEDKKS